MEPTTGFNGLTFQEDYLTENDFNQDLFSSVLAANLRRFGEEGTAPGIKFLLDGTVTITQITDDKTKGLSKILPIIQQGIASIVKHLTSPETAYEFDSGWHLITHPDRIKKTHTKVQASSIHQNILVALQKKFPGFKCSEHTHEEDAQDWNFTPSATSSQSATYAQAEPAGWLDEMWYKIFDGSAPWKLQKYDLQLKELNAALDRGGIRLSEYAGDKPISARTYIQASVNQGLTNSEREHLRKMANAVLQVQEAPDTSWYGWTKSFVVSEKKSQRDFFRDFIAAFRAAWKEEDKAAIKSRKFSQMLSKIGFTFYHNIFVHEYHRQLVNQFIIWGSYGQVDNPTTSNFSLTQEIEFIRHVDSKHRMPATAKYITKGYEMFVEMDPITNGNLPFVLGLVGIKNQTPITWVRQAVPLIGDRTKGKYTVSPEFKAAVAHMAEINHKRLYIHLADSQPGVENEQAFFPPLLELAKKYPNHFILVRFDHDTPFAHQSNPSPEAPNCMRAFKAQFKGMLKANSLGGYYFPDQWLDSKPFEETIERIVDFVHSEFYSDTGELGQQDRVTFIRLTNTLIAAYLIFVKVKPSSFNFTCRNGRDRAQEEARRMMEFLGLVLGKQEDFTFREDKKAATHAAAIISNKQQIIDPRRTYLILAVDQKFQDSRVKAGVKKFYEEFIEGQGLELEDLQFPRNPMQQLET